MGFTHNITVNNVFHKYGECVNDILPFIEKCQYKTVNGSNQSNIDSTVCILRTCLDYVDGVLPSAILRVAIQYCGDEWFSNLHGDICLYVQVLCRVAGEDVKTLLFYQEGNPELDSLYNTALHVAVIMQNIEVAKLLLHYAGNDATKLVYTKIYVEIAR